LNKNILSDFLKFSLMKRKNNPNLIDNIGIF
jgi:hypothetical protein